MKSSTKVLKRSLWLVRSGLSLSIYLYAAIALNATEEGVDSGQSNRRGPTGLHSLKNAVDGLDEKVVILEKGVARLPDASQQAEELEKDNAELEREMDKLRKRFKKLQKELEEGLSMDDSATVEGLEVKLKELRKLLNELEQRQKKIGSPAMMKEKASRLAQQIAELEQKIKQLQARLKTLKDALLEFGSTTTKKSSASLQEQLQKLEEIYAKLKEQKQNLEDAIALEKKDNERDKDYKAKFGQGRTSKKDVHSIAVVGNKAVPIEEPYFDFEWDTVTHGIYRYKYVSKATRVKEGESVRKAFDDGGCVSDILDECDADSDYIKLFVCPDSIAAFRAIVRESKRRGIDFFWIPYDDTPIEGGAGASGSAPMM